MYALKRTLYVGNDAENIRARKDREELYEWLCVLLMIDDTLKDLRVYIYNIAVKGNRNSRYT